jgi:hypothetical protein
MKGDKKKKWLGRSKRCLLLGENTERGESGARKEVWRKKKRVRSKVAMTTNERRVAGLDVTLWQSTNWGP